MTEDAVHSPTAGGVIGERVLTAPEPMRVAPTIAAGRNTIRAAAVPFACWRANDMRFEFESSFVRPEIASEIGALKELIDRHTPANATAGGGGPALSVFGHADPTGDDEFNKLLSGRRAQAIYAMLVRRVDLWEDLHANPLGNDRWGPNVIHTMQTALGRPTSNHLSAADRQALFRDYMDFVCTARDEDGIPITDPTGKPVTLELKPTDFLGNGADPGGKGDFQGCGEFNPVLIFSEQENTAFSQASQKPERDEENAPNRRVVIYLFRPGIRVTAARWPCPRAKEGGSGCKKRFFSDGEARRTRRLPDTRRRYDETPDTFGCRLYDRMTNASPCERIPTGHGAFFMQCLTGDGQNVLANRKYVIRSQGSPTIQFTGMLGDDGTLAHEGVPANDYILSVQGCGETTPIAVLRSLVDGCQIRMLENGRLGFHVRTPDGDPVVNAAVSVRGAGDQRTDEDGLAYFNLVDQGAHEFTVTKAGFTAAAASPAAVRGLVGAEPAAASGDGSAAKGSVTVGDRRLDVVVTLDTKPPKVVPQVVQIEARQNVTTSLRDRSAKPSPPPRDPVVLAASTSSSMDMTKNAAVVLVRGSQRVFLTAKTNPPGQLVTWDVVQNQTSRPPPTLDGKQTLGDFSVQLSTDTTGSFAVRATIGASVIVWNVILVGVDLDPATPQPVVQPSRLTDLIDFLDTPEGKKAFGLGVSDHFNKTDSTGVASGTFEFGKHAFSSEVRVTLKGGGAAEDLGCDKVVVQILQNLTDDRVAGEYATKIAFTDNVSPVAYPVTDTSGGSPPGYDGPTLGAVIINGAPVLQTPFLHSPGMFKLIKNDPRARILQIGDSPAVGFSTREPASREELTRIRGDQRFRVAVVSFSTDAKNAIVAHADLLWMADYTGDVSVSSGIGHWSRDGADVKVVQTWAPIRSSSGVQGTDATNALLEISKPLAITLQDIPKKIIPKP